MEQLTQYGKRLTDRLGKVGKDRTWLVRQMCASGNSITMSELEQLMTETNVSRKRQETAARFVHDEEERQRLKKSLRIKR